ncbi:PF09995 family protein [Leptospira fainei serovar Hurstbridge str. BUT 6]|uniref:PF09995 family protein n=1 Tax=Leptospira fainei serovar Hurstbridge str. BUT 6 TaxID=1193011 RepID=S3UTS2_9LEPT|nr:oxygenase MpaB family protein [Leptospira fainei]EPG72653.1 PF09995 family protein [Leptospira fainei serovar Hurstbridge str. BUT 6]
MDTKELRALRQETDPIADEIIRKYFNESAFDQPKTLLFFDFLAKNSDPIPPGLPPYFEEYFETTEVLPDWTDQNKIRQAQGIFSRFGGQILMMLCVKSLPMAYSCGDGAQVLLKTGRLVEQNRSLSNVNRRLMETTQFVISVLQADGLGPNGRGIRVSQKVRLIHASIRYFLSQSSDWNPDLGKPINQEDMAGTLQSFSSLVIEGLAQSSILLTDEEKDSYIHLWRVVGHLIGVKLELCPESFSDAHALGESIFLDQRKSSEAGKILTQSLIDFMEYMLPGNLFDNLPLYFIQTYMGEDTSKVLGLPWPPKDLLGGFLERIFVDVDFHLDEDKGFGKLVSFFSSKLLFSMDHFYYDGKRARFWIPPSLRENWGV